LAKRVRRWWGFDMEWSKNDEMVYDAIKYSNSLLLKASEQGGFLAAAVIAVYGFWSSGEQILINHLLIFGALVLSIVCSILTHLFIGTTYLNQMRRIISGEISNNAFLIKTPFITAAIQALFLIAGLSLVMATMFINT